MTNGRPIYVCIICMLVDVHRCQVSHTHTHAHAHIHTYTHKHTCAHTHTHTNTYIHTHARTCAHTYTHIHTHIQRHTHTRVRARTHTHTDLKFWLIVLTFTPTQIGLHKWMTPKSNILHSEKSSWFYKILQWSFKENFSPNL